MTDETDDGANSPGPPAADRGVYGISVAAELSGVSKQSLRLYETHGLVTPTRSPGGTRRYSADDLVRLQRVSELVAAGINLAGIVRILSLEDQNIALNDLNVTLEGDNDALRAENKRRRTPKQP
ncbi:MerR family transcriptional regulator [Mycobacterium sp. NPDC051804]|uniref:MerR family transcriptional regulator n=1 Tax=Mycobacterium sp. NPDC051804 TaxID=3364295 RepID=UPI0037873426